MAGCDRSPTEVLSHLLGCSSVFLQTLPGSRGLPSRVLVGVAGVANPYACGGPNCDGLLYIESMNDFEKIGDDTNVMGGDCEAAYKNSYRITVSRCAPVFDSESTTGAAVDVAARNSLATIILSDMWAMMAAIRCCLLDDGIACGGQVTGGGHSLESGCATYWTNVEWEHLLCC